MSLVEIARFSNGADADIAVSFLLRHGVKAVRPRRDSPWAYMALGEASIFAEVDHAEKAQALLQRVLRGEFADHDPAAKSGSGLGAALSRSILPVPGYSQPRRLVALAPIMILAGVFAGMLLIQFAVALSRGEIG